MNELKYCVPFNAHGRTGAVAELDRRRLNEMETLTVRGGRFYAEQIRLVSNRLSPPKKNVCENICQLFTLHFSI